MKKLISFLFIVLSGCSVDARKTKHNGLSAPTNKILKPKFSKIKIAQNLYVLKDQTNRHHSHYINKEDFFYNQEVTFSDQLMKKVTGDKIFRKKNNKKAISYFLIKNPTNFFRIVEEHILSDKAVVSGIEKTYITGVYKVMIKFNFSCDELVQINGSEQVRPLGITIFFYPKEKKVISIEKSTHCNMIVDFLRNRIISFFPAGNGGAIEKDLLDMFLKEILLGKHDKK